MSLPDEPSRHAMFPRIALPNNCPLAFATISPQSLDQKTFIPVTLKQIDDAAKAAGDGDLMIGDKANPQVAVVAIIQARESTDSYTEFTLTDGTATMKTRLWSHTSPVTSEQLDSTVSGHYAKFVLNSRTANGRRLFNVVYCRGIIDGNEVTNHMLQVMAAHVYLAEGKRLTAAPVGGDAGAAGAAMVGGMPGMTSFNAPGAAGAAIAGASAEDSLKDVIIEAFKSLGMHSEEGASIQQVASHLRGNGQSLADSQLKSLIDTLVYDGHLYSTTDEQHFASTM